jgi:hypothetical protein
MRFSAYVMFLLAVSLPLYFLGYNSVVGEFITPHPITTGNASLNFAPGNQTIQIGCDTGDPYCQQQQSQPSVLWIFLALLLGAFILATLLTGFAAMYVIPAIILIGVVNLVVLPYSFIQTSGMPLVISIPLLVIFNFITVIASVDLVRGGA